MGDETVPGLVALMARGDQVHVEALGSLSVGGPAVQRDSLFRISPNSKPATGVATLALVRKGLLDLDEPVARLLRVPLSSMRGTSVSGSTNPRAPRSSSRFTLSHSQHTVRWQAHDAAGHETSSGPAIMP